MLEKVWMKSIGVLSMTLIAISSASAGTLTVNTTVDTDDGACTAENCTMREAITAANQQVGTDTISFQIPLSDGGYKGGVWEIRVQSPLPELTDDQTIIDGRTQTSWAGNSNNAGPEIALLSSRPYQPSVVSNTMGYGLKVVAAQCEIRGLAVGGFIDGVRLAGSRCRSTLVSGCYVGLSADGKEAVPNQSGVVLYDGTSSNRIGGTSAVERNVISGNGTGIYANNNNFSKPEPPQNNDIIGNYIGTDPTGIVAVPNGNGLFWGASNSRIGGSQPGAGNVIAGNSFGCYISNDYANGNLVQGNSFGVGADGTTALANTYLGLVIEHGASNNVVGGLVNGESNVFANSRHAQVLVQGTRSSDGVRHATGNSIRGNVIRAGESVAIDLVPIDSWGNPTPNDSLDADLGGNNLQNHPEVENVLHNNSSVSGRVRLHSVPNAVFDIDFYQSTSTGSRGDGTKYLGSASVATGADGNVSQAFRFAVAGFTSDFQMAATATRRSTGDTSEFGTIVAVRRYFPLLVSITSPSSVVRSLNIAGSVSGTYAINSVQVSMRRLSDNLFWNGVNWVSGSREVSAVLNAGRWQVPSNLLPSGQGLRDGRYLLTVKGTDSALQTRTAVRNFWVDQNPPLIVFLSPRANSSYSTFPNILGRAVDATGGTGRARVVLFIRRMSDGRYWSGSNWGMQPVELNTTLDANNFLRTTNLPQGANLRAGQYRIMAIAVDGAGNRSSIQTSLQIVSNATSATRQLEVDGEDDEES